MSVRENELGRGPRADTARTYLRRDEGERVRAMRGTQFWDPFAIPQELLDMWPDLDFNWKNFEVFGQPDARQVHFEQQQGWRACTHDMFPGFYAPIGEPGHILVKEMILMERPKKLSLQARQEEIDRALFNQRANQQRAAQTPQGTAPRLQPRFGSATTPIEIPDD